MALAKCKRSFTAYKGHLTRAVENSELLLQASTIDLEEIRNTIERLKQRWTNYETAYEKIESLLIEGDIKEGEIDSMQEEFYEQEAKYQNQLAQLRSKVNVNTVKIGSDPSDAVVTVLKPKLPAIKIPVFSGDIIEYESFIDQFEAQIGGRSDLEPVTKL